MKFRNCGTGLVLGLVVLIIGSLLLTGCDSKSSGSESETAAQVSTVSLSPSTLNVGSTSIVEAVITENGQPVASRVVLFSATPAGAGTFDPTSAITDANGLAASVFTAAESGPATITARISDAAYNTASMSINSSQQTGGEGNVTIDVTPSLLLANGSATSEITVTILDSELEAAPESTLVLLTAGERFDDIDGNGYFTPSVDTVIYDVIENDSWDAIGYIPSSAYVEGTQGQVTVTYVAGTMPTSVYILATVEDATITGYSETSLQLTPNATIESIYLFSDSNSLAVQGTGGMETAMMSAIGYDLYGNRVPEGVVVTFIITDGPGGGERLGDVDYGPYATTTNAQGVATCPISSGTVSGTIRIRAASGTVMSTMTPIMIHAGPPAHIVVGSEACNTASWTMVDDEVGIIALVSDVNNNPVKDSVAVYFTVDEGSIMSHMTRTGEDKGKAKSIWLSGYRPPTADGIVRVIAETNGGALACTTVFVNSHLPASIEFLEPFPVTTDADGKTTETFWVDVRDLNDNYVVEGTKLDIGSNHLSALIEDVGDGCNMSVAKGQYQSVVLSMDHYWLPTDTEDNGIGAVDYIQVSFGGMVGASHACTLYTGEAFRDGCYIAIDASVTNGTSVPFSVKIKDRWNNPLGGHRLVAGLSGGGSISNGTQYSNKYGEAEGFVYNAPPTGTPSGNVVVTVVDMDPRGGLTLTTTISISD